MAENRYKRAEKVFPISFDTGSKETIFSLHSLLGNQSSHINNPSNNLNVKLCVRSQVTRKLVLS